MAIEIRSVFDSKGIDGSPLWFAFAVDSETDLSLVDAVGETEEKSIRNCVKRLRYYRPGCEYEVVGSEEEGKP